MIPIPLPWGSSRGTASAKKATSGRVPRSPPHHGHATDLSPHEPEQHPSPSEDSGDIPQKFLPSKYLFSRPSGSDSPRCFLGCFKAEAIQESWESSSESRSWVNSTGRGAPTLHICWVFPGDLLWTKAALGRVVLLLLEQMDRNISHMTQILDGSTRNSRQERAGWTSNHPGFMDNPTKSIPALLRDLPHFSFPLDLQAKRPKFQVFAAPKPVAVKVYKIPANSGCRLSGKSDPR